MSVEQSRECVQWDGNRVVGGEPQWFKELAAGGDIKRSADGVGSVLWIVTGPRIMEVYPGQFIMRSAEGALSMSDTDQQGKGSGMIIARHGIADDPSAIRSA